MGLAYCKCFYLQACGDPHNKGDLGVGQAHVVPQDQCLALPRWKGVKGSHEKGLVGGHVLLPNWGGPGCRLDGSERATR